MRYYDLFCLICLLAVLSGCFAPKSVRSTRESETCQLKTRQFTLEMTPDLSSREHAGVFIPNCSGEDCATLAAALLAIPVGSFIISGSIVVVGNTFHWIEQQGTCSESIVQESMTELADATQLAGEALFESAEELLQWAQKKSTFER